MKIVTILGARPQFIKAGSISREIVKRVKEGEKIVEVIIHTGQHYDSNMSDIFFEEMSLPKPSYNLGIGGGTHGSMTGQMIESIEKVLLMEKPDWVLVYGDTNSTLAGALAASKLHIKIAHVEAGLRSFNNRMPEEINRILTDRLSSALFCPTAISIKNLEKEGISSWGGGVDLCLVGDVMLDGVEFYKNKSVKPDVEIADDFVLCTIHRAESTDDPEILRGIISALKIISKSTQVVLPLHPRCKQVIKKYSIDCSGVKILEPLGYLNMIWMIQNCSLVMTDSGGLQKEAYFFGKKCITLRSETEWLELVEHKYNLLVGTDTTSILEAYEGFSSTFEVKPGLYGNGNASELILERLIYGI
jgi:UDP-GlcNAc3NAcA epimerase